jgi:hypothetical protein
MAKYGSEEFQMMVTQYVGKKELRPKEVSYKKLLITLKLNNLKKDFLFIQN